MYSYCIEPIYLLSCVLLLMIYFGTDQSAVRFSTFVDLKSRANSIRVTETAIVDQLGPSISLLLFSSLFHTQISFNTCSSLHFAQQMIFSTIPSLENALIYDSIMISSETII